MLGSLVGAIRSCAGKQDLMLVGAAARDLLLQHLHGIVPPRKTNDVDLAFAVPDWTTYEALKRALIASGHFTPDERLRHRLSSEMGLPVDLIPFGGVEAPNAEIAWPPDGDEVMSVIGYAEARASANEVLLPGEGPIAVPTLPMFALLKLFAWEDRHLVQPRKDATDLLFLLDSAFQVTGLERLAESAPEMLEADDFDVDLAGAWLLGADARTTIDRHSGRGREIVARARETLERESDPAGPLTLIGQLQSANPERSRLKLIAFGNGLHRVGMLTQKGFGSD